MSFKPVNLNKTTINEIWKLNFIVIVIGTVTTLLILFVLKNSINLSLFLLTAKTFTDLTLTSFCLLEIFKIATSKYKTNHVKLKLFRYSLSFISAIIINLSLWYFYCLIDGLIENIFNITLLTNYVFMSILVARSFIFLHDYVVLRRNKIQTDLENERLKTKNAEAANLILKQQIHPHFLFNSLNTIKALYKKDTNQGEEYLIQLANFLRIAVSNNNASITTITDELKMCENFLKMQKIRFGNALDWEIKIKDEDKERGGFLLSFSLQPLLENAIKHNIISEEVSLKIVIEQVGDIISVKNVIHEKKYNEISTRTGLKNLAERYLLWSGEEIKITSIDNVFCVSLKIQQNENPNH